MEGRSLPRAWKILLVVNNYEESKKTSSTYSEEIAAMNEC